MANERRVWATVHTTADPFNEFHLYVTQELLGAWVDNPQIGNKPEWVPADGPLLTRVLYARMTNTGKLENVNTGSWEGRR